MNTASVCERHYPQKFTGIKLSRRLRALMSSSTQTPTFVDDVILGCMLGVAFGVWNVVATGLDPLSDDTPSALLIFYGPMFTAWGLASFAVARRSGRVIDGIKAGTTVAFVTFAVFWVANLIRVNLFLDSIRHRADWQDLVARFHASDFDSLRAFANYDYLSGAPFKIVVAATIGAATGLIGGLLAMLVRRAPRELPRS